MRVTHVTSWLSHAGGGVSEAVRCLSVALATQCDVRAVGLSDAAWPKDKGGWSHVRVSAEAVVGPNAFGYSPRFLSRLRDTDPQIVHAHGLWMYPTWASLRWSNHRRQKPYLVSPHGMLEDWALAQSRLKKGIAMRLFQREQLERAACLHALNEEEAAIIRGLGLTNPVCIIPNGVELPEDYELSGLDGTTANRRPGSGKVLLYLGRLHPKKNLGNLIRAWLDVAASDWTMTIAGWGDRHYEQELRELAGTSRTIRFVGPVFGPAKHSLLSSATAFVLPSMSEGLPMAVLEAWSYRLPVAMTRECNLAVGFAEGAAFRVATALDQLRADLAVFLDQSSAEFVTMGNAGRRIVEERYTWPKVANDMLGVYEWIVGVGARPSSIV